MIKDKIEEASVHITVSKGFKIVKKRELLKNYILYCTLSLIIGGVIGYLICGQ